MASSTFEKFSFSIWDPNVFKNDAIDVESFSARKESW